MSRRPHEARTTDLLRQSLAENTEAHITLERFLAPLEERAYGFLLLLLALPNFIPIPFGIGAVMGVLVILVGLQLLIGLGRPWLPRTARQRGFARASVEHFLTKMTPVLGWLERVCTPRLETLTHRPASRFTGLLLIVTGFLLSLPIPFTNYLFGLIVLLFAVAQIERDGALLIAVWVIALGVATATFLLSNVAFDWIVRWFH